MKGQDERILWGFGDELSPASRKAARAGINDVAFAAGVSTATVSRALRDHNGVAPATRDRILETAERLGYIPSAAAAALVTGRTGYVGVLMPLPRSKFFADALTGAYCALAHTKYELCLFIAEDDTSWAADLKNSASRIDALLVLEPTLTADVPEGLITHVMTKTPLPVDGPADARDLRNASRRQGAAAMNQLLALIEAYSRTLKPINRRKHADPTRESRHSSDLR